ncbi:MAG: ATP-binding protein, partial [Lysobacter spongiicola]|nr:ATP-binding protein [Lysobacter spongiicola]
LVAWWLSRQIGRLRQYAHAVTAGERADAPRAAGEFGELGRALETMRTRLEGKQYVEQYVHTLTHEMKSPLAAIRGSAELLESPLPEADRRHFAGSIRTQSERLAQMIDKLLALAAVEHRQRIDAVPLRLDLLVREVEALCEPRLEAASVRLESKITGAPVVAGDAFLLRQAIANLVENAIDFAPAGSRVKVELSSATADGEGEVVLEVADEGPGVPDYALPRVFERFFSLPRPRGGSRSSGLGLCFVAEVAALHGGRATLGNREGGGAVARLHLPLHA